MVVTLLFARSLTRSRVRMGQAIEWLSYTYLMLRMKRNPLQYGLSMTDVEDDPQLQTRRSVKLFRTLYEWHACSAHTAARLCYHTCPRQFSAASSSRRVPASWTRRA